MHNLPWNIFLYGTLEAKGWKLMYQTHGSSCSTYLWWCGRVRSIWSPLSIQKVENAYLVFWIYSINWFHGQIKRADGESPILPSAISSSELRWYQAYSKSPVIRNPTLWRSATETKRITCAESMQTKNKQSQKDIGINSPTERIGTWMQVFERSDHTPRPTWNSISGQFSRLQSNFVAYSWLRLRIKQLRIYKIS